MISVSIGNTDSEGQTVSLGFPTIQYLPGMYHVRSSGLLLVVAGYLQTANLWVDV